LFEWHGIQFIPFEYASPANEILFFAAQYQISLGRLYWTKVVYANAEFPVKFLLAMKNMYFGGGANGFACQLNW
jgi:hypothetical protein